jgi:hypothetical protein
LNAWSTAKRPMRTPGTVGFRGSFLPVLAGRSARPAQTCRQNKARCSGQGQSFTREAS